MISVTFIFSSFQWKMQSHCKTCSWFDFIVCYSLPSPLQRSGLASHLFKRSDLSVSLSDLPTVPPPYGLTVLPSNRLPDSPLACEILFRMAHTSRAKRRPPFSPFTPHPSNFALPCREHRWDGPCEPHSQIPTSTHATGTIWLQPCGSLLHRS